jgi:hypothetical protein
MGVAASTFVDTYADDVKAMKLMLLNYMKAIRNKQSQPDLPFGIGEDQHRPKLILETTTEGYPILPIPLPCHNWNKQDWEDLFAMYIGRHYSKAFKIS